jgi:LysR family glycine cleavage system transcriptional activator
MTSRLPSLRAVAIFVAAGRTLSFTEAAKTVNLTPSAVSRRIRDLERELGTALFRRFNRRLELTPAGARYLAGVSQAIELIERESDAIRPRRRGATLRLSVLQSFASLWLLPKLAAFKSVRPDIDVQVETSTELIDVVDQRCAGRFWAKQRALACAELTRGRRNVVCRADRAARSVR